MTQCLHYREYYHHLTRLVIVNLVDSARLDLRKMMSSNYVDSRLTRLSIMYNDDDVGQDELAKTRRVVRIMANEVAC